MIELNISGWVKSSITLDSAKMGTPVRPQDRQLSSLFYDTTSKNWYLEVFEPYWGDCYYFKSNDSFEMLDYIGYTSVNNSAENLKKKNIDIMKIDEDEECTDVRQVKGKEVNQSKLKFTKKRLTKTQFKLYLLM